MRNKLKVLRAEHNMTQEVLADKLEVTRQTIISIESGRYTPSLPLAFKIAKLFDKRIEEIFMTYKRSIHPCTKTAGFSRILL